MKSNTVCVLPWIQVATKPNGHVNLCCISTHTVLQNKEAGRPFRLDLDLISDVWNCEELIEIRQQMLANQKPKSCEVCYREEAMGKTSLRKFKNKQWLENDNYALEERLQKTVLKDHDSQPFYFDLRLGNNCNLKCRMCFPVNSSGVSSEYKKILSSSVPFPNIYENVYENGNFNWSESEHFKSTFRSCFAYIKELYFTGGEPMLSRFVENLLDELIKCEASDQIVLTFNTNTTIWNENIIKKFNFFKEVNIASSIDGIDKTDEYIRYPTSFFQVNQNFDQYVEMINSCDNTRLAISTAVSWLNIFELPALAAWLLKKNICNNKFFHGICFSPVYQPYTLNLRMIPESLKEKAKSSLLLAENILSQSNFSEKMGLENLRSLANFLEAKSSVQTKFAIDLVNQIESIDKLRKQNLKSYIPSAYKVFEFYKTSI